MNARWWLGVCALVLSACGGGGDEGSTQSPFQVLVEQARSHPTETLCETRAGYSELSTLEVRVSASGQTVEAFDRASYHGSSNCTGAALVQYRVVSGSNEVPVTRITYVSSLRSAQVRLLDGRTLNTPVDRVNVGVNPDAGVYRFDFIGIEGTQQTTGFITSASFVINGVTVNEVQELESLPSAAIGMALVNGQVISLVPHPQSDTVFVQTVEQ